MKALKKPFKIKSQQSSTKHLSSGIQKEDLCAASITFPMSLFDESHSFLEVVLSHYSRIFFVGVQRHKKQNVPLCMNLSIIQTVTISIVVTRSTAKWAQSQQLSSRGLKKISTYI